MTTSVSLVSDGPIY